MNSKGFYVVGRYGQSVAWSLAYRDALRLATQLNYRGGTIYRVEAAR